MSFAFNINENIEFKLTEYGNQIWNEWHRKWQQAIPNYSIPPLPSRMQLWCFMEVFGPHFHIGVSNIIDGNEIRFDV